MQISEMALKELEIIWRQDNPNMPISREKLLEMGQRILNAVSAVYGPFLGQLEAQKNDKPSSQDQRL